jgi:3-hydroxyanthranilate 3,4-dioxygenase
VHGGEVAAGSREHARDHYRGKTHPVATIRTRHNYNSLALAYHTPITFGTHTMPSLQPLNLQRWIDDNRALLKPPVGNKRIFRESEFIIMVVGGPNTRRDYHVDPAEEFFYQLQGDMLLKTIQEDRAVDVPIRAGEILLLPPRVPHSPQRGADTVGLVIERERRAGELDGFQWYCEGCGNLLFEEFIALTDIEKELPPLFQRFYASAERRTCAVCGTVMQPPSAARGS